MTSRLELRLLLRLRALGSFAILHTRQREHHARRGEPTQSTSTVPERVRESESETAGMFSAMYVVE